MHHPSECFECKIRLTDQRLRNFIDRMPDGAWPMVRSRIMRPIMEQVVVACQKPLGLDPAWMDALPANFNDARGPKRLYHEACAQLLDATKKPNLRRVNFLLETIVAVFLGGKVPTHVYVHVWTQLFELTGRNRVFWMVMEHVDMFISPTVEDLGAWLRDVGADEYGLTVLKGLQADARWGIDNHAARTRKRMRTLENAGRNIDRLVVDVEAKGSAQRRLAVAMVLHERLGQGAWLGKLEPGVVRMCALMADVPKMLRWTDVMQFSV